MQPPIKHFRDHCAKHEWVLSQDVVNYLDDYRTHIQGPGNQRKPPESNVAAMFDDVDISARTASDMRVEMQEVIDRYVARVTNAEAIGVCMMAMGSILFDYDKADEADGAG